MTDKSEVVNIAGIPRKITIQKIPIEHIVLDETNPRIGSAVDSNPYGELSQEEIEIFIRSDREAFRRLRYSIESNEDILYPIWVKRIDDGRFKVIDGNTRVIIFRDLNKKYPNKECFKHISSKILPDDCDEKDENFIRLIAHLRGVNDWEVYERARLLYILWEKKGYSEEELESQTNLNIVEIKKLIKAYRELTEQFIPLYSPQDPTEPINKMSYFIEFQNKRIQTGMQKNNLNVRDFCRWVGEGQITKAQDVRDLKRILEDKEATKYLVERGYEFAIEKLSELHPEFRDKLFESIEETLEGLRQMTRGEEDELLNGKNPNKLKKIDELYRELSRLLKMRCD